MPLPDADALALRIGAKKLARIFDDERTGTALAEAVDQCMADAKSKVFGYLRGNYDLDALELSPPNELNRLILDVAQAYAIQRHPEVAKGDWVALMEQADRDLKALRRAETRLDVVGPPEPAANVGGTSTNGDPETFTATEFKPIFGWGKEGTGDF